MYVHGHCAVRSFSTVKRTVGNYITFDASNLSCASISTKLALQAMVDRGALTPNEWRETFNLSPLEGGDEPLRRLDTETVNEGTKPTDEEVNKDGKNQH